MGLETTVNFISDLNPLNPAEGDLAKDGDNHIRFIKAALKQTFPNITGDVTATHNQLNYMVGVTSPVQTQLSSLQSQISATQSMPSGGIIMWSGSIASIPAGWFLCNGLNGTPNLQDRFVVGAGSAYAVGDTGGAATVALTLEQTPAHTHTFSGNTGGQSADHNHAGWTDSQGAHTHTAFANRDSGGSSSTARPTTGSPALTGSSNLPTDSAGAHTHNVGTYGSSNDHSHAYSGTTSWVGSGWGHENRPPYYALAYIMKA
jgi:microcystin-dependent protein